jgi:putative hydrolase of the HAD superfamily
MARVLADRFKAQRGYHHQPYEDVLPALTSLQGRYTLAIATNGFADLERMKLNGAGLGDFFTATAISGEEGIVGPALITNVLDKLAVSPSEAAFVADDFGEDIPALRASGLKAVWLNRSGEQQTDVFEATITSLDELEATLDELAAVGTRGG